MNIKKSIRTGVAAVYRILAAAHIVPPAEIIVKMDGGICSQMHFYMVGQLFQEKGIPVSYDTGWFSRDGMDNNRQYARNFDLLKLFPALDFREAGPVKIWLYNKLFIYYNDYYRSNPYAYMALVAPRILSGYYHTSPERFRSFRNYFKLTPEVLSPESKRIYDEIVAEPNAVAVHVRRGDLSEYHKAYGAPASIGYFATAADLMHRRNEGCRFFVFSDEPDWCRTNLNIEGGVIVDINGSDRGYMDLVLMAACRHFITSKGSLGKYAALLALRNGDIILCDDEIERVWGECFDAPIFLRNTGVDES